MNNYKTLSRLAAIIAYSTALIVLEHVITLRYAAAYTNLPASAIMAVGISFLISCISLFLAWFWGET